MGRDPRKCQYCNYVWESVAQRESHEEYIQLMARMFDRLEEEIEGGV